MDEGQRQRVALWAILLTPLAILLVLGPLAYAFTSEWSHRWLAWGLAFELAGVLAILVRALVEEIGFWFIRGEADKKTLRVFYFGGPLLAIGFALQFMSVVFL